jgi:hypothetical protein
MNAQRLVIAGLASVVLLTAGCGSSAEPDALDKTAFSSTLANAIAAQNAAAFGGQTEDQRRSEEAFTAKLSASAADSYAEQSASLADLADSGTSVISTTVSVEQVSTAPGTNGHTEVTANLHVSRALRDGAIWEEVIPYVSSIDNATGVVDSLVIEDDAWLLSQH